MFSGFDRVLTFSRGVIRHKALNGLLGDRLVYSPSSFGSGDCVIGWGLKENTAKAVAAAERHNLPYYRIEDGFFRSIGLGVEGAAPFSIVVDNLGIYYDATSPSGLEKILAEYDFENDHELLVKADQAITLIRRFNLSKYNYAPNLADTDLKDNGRPNILIVAQTAGDMSLVYGASDQFRTADLIRAAINENPTANIYLKIHPDVLAGKKNSDINPNEIPANIQVIAKDIQSTSLLKRIDKVYTKTSQMGFEALLLGKECVCFGMPFYAGWGLTDDRVDNGFRTRKLSFRELFAGAAILYSIYYNPYLKTKTDIIDALYTLHRYREIELCNRRPMLFYRFTPWKKFYHTHFFQAGSKHARTFCSSAKKVAATANGDSAIIVWSRPASDILKNFKRLKRISKYYVEDGFIRSVSLGSNLTRPYSLVVDSRGLYFDPTTESDLEYILNTYDFQGHTGLLERANKVAKQIVAAKISKYNAAPHQQLFVDRSKHDKVILVPGQVANDASLRLGGCGMNNLALLKSVREANPNSYLIYKPHPDVVAGNRSCTLSNDQAQLYCNSIITDASIDTCINIADEIHTITSLCGFDALLRGKKVVTYGMPFYAGWGLTNDTQELQRRKRQLKLNELVAGTLLIYPRYLHPQTRQFCEVEDILQAVRKEQRLYNQSISHRGVQKLRNTLLTAPVKMMKQITGGHA